MTTVQVSPLNLLRLIEKSIEIGEIDCALGFIREAIEQLEAEDMAAFDKLREDAKTSENDE